MKRPWKIGILLSLAVFGAVLFNLLGSLPKVNAANPTTMSFQGKVVNADGTNVTDGNYSFLFKLYTVSSGGSAVWTETQSSVTVAGGVFQVNLGSVCPFFTANACNGSTPIDFSASNSLYLGITFNSDPAGEMTPRPQLQSIPYAFQADNASKLGGLAASNYAQLSPGSQQSGFLNVSGAGTFGSALTVSAGGASITGNSSVTGNLAVTNRFNAPSTTGTSGQGYFVQNSTPNNLASFQALDLGGNTYSFLANNKYYNGTGWVDDGLGRTGSSFQIQNDSFNFYSFDTSTNFTSRFVVASGGNVGIGSNVTPGYLLDVQGGDINTSANLRTAGAIRLDNAGNLTNIGNLTMSGTLGVTGNINTTNGNILIQQTAAGASAIFNDVAGKIGSIKAGAAKVAFLFDSSGNFSIGSDTRTNIAASNTAGTDVLTILGASGNVGIGDTTPSAALSVGSGHLFTVDGVSGNVTTAGTITGTTLNGTTGINTGATAGTQRIDNSGNLLNIGTITASGLETLSATGVNALALTGAPVNTATLSLIRIGSAIASGNVAANGGTYIGLNAPSSGAGSAADFVNLQLNGVSKFKVDSGGNVTAAATVNAATGYKFNGTAGVTVTCTGNNYLPNMVVQGGIITGNAACAGIGLSDQRVKKDIVSLDSSVLDSIKNVNPVSFFYDCNNTYFTQSNTYCDPAHQTGVIAQQLAQVFPDLVYQDSYGYYHVDYQGLSAYTLKATSEIAQHLDSVGNATLNNVTVNHLTVNDGTSTTASTGSYSSSVITPQLISSGALVINSGSSGDVSIDSGGNSASVNIGATNAAGVNIARTGSTTEVKGALSVDQAADFGGNVTMHFKNSDDAFSIDNTGSTQAVGAAIQIKDSAGSGYTSLISTPNFSVAGNGDITTDGSITSKGGSFQLLDPAGQQLISFDQSGNANFKGSLNLSSAALNGGLTVGGDVNVAGLSTFQKLATFIGKTIFRQDVQFDGHITVASDTAGYATLRTGESSVHVTFKTAYETVPVVSTNIMSGQFGLAGVNNVTKQGFDISLPVAATADLTLSWTAIAVTNPQTASNTLSSPTPTPTPSLTP